MAEIINKVVYSADQYDFLYELEKELEIDLTKLFDLFGLKRIQIQHPLEDLECIIDCQRVNLDSTVSLIDVETMEDYGVVTNDVIVISSEFNRPNTMQKSTIKMMWAYNGKSEKYMLYPLDKTASENQKLCSRTLLDVYITLFLMQNGNDVFETAERVVKIKKTKSKKKGHKSQTTVNRHYKIFTIKNKDEIRRSISKHRKITCELWEVSGHYRTYKNGKTVFVRPYKKGKKRNENITIEKTHLVIPT
mgnify:CR=1 FL=1